MAKRPGCPSTVIARPGSWLSHASPDVFVCPSSLTQPLRTPKGSRRVMGEKQLVVSACGCCDERCEGDRGGEDEPVTSHTVMTTRVWVWFPTQGHGGASYASNRTSVLAAPSDGIPESDFLRLA